jgi:hypothetical protein
MFKINKKNLPLIIALCIPAIMILAVAAAIYLPGIGKSPKHNFLYITGDYVRYGYNSNSDYEYVVKGDRVEQVYVQRDPNNFPKYQYNAIEPRLYLYDVSKNESLELTLEQAQNYSLDPSNTSLDGFVVIQGNYNGGGFFGGVGSDSDSWFIKGHNRSFKLNLKLLGTYTYDNFKFLGWIK